MFPSLQLNHMWLTASLYSFFKVFHGKFWNLSIHLLSKLNDFYVLVKIFMDSDRVFLNEREFGKPKLIPVALAVCDPGLGDGRVVK